MSKTELLTAHDKMIKKTLEERHGLKTSITFRHKKCGGGTFRRLQFKKYNGDDYIPVIVPYYCCDKCYELCQVDLKITPVKPRRVIR